MPVIPTVKTYGRSKNVNSNYLSKHTAFPSSEASNVFDALFARNIEKRNTSSEKKKKIITRARRKQEIIELPLPGPSQLSSDDSVHFRANTTFDNLLKGPQYNKVKFCNASVIQVDSSTDNSKGSDDHSSGYNTRKNVRKDYAKLHSNNERIKSKVNSKGKVNKQKISEKKKLSKSIKVVLKQIADESTSDTVPKKDISNSFDKSISHSLIIEKETKNRDQNSIELSRIIAEENRKYREKYFNASVTCARKFTPIISTSQNLPKNASTSESSYSRLFQHGFRHCMQAESTPKYLLSSTPIPTNKQHKIADNPDVSPITARCGGSQLTCKSRLVSLMGNNSDCEIVTSFKPSSKPSLLSTSSKDTMNLISSLKPEETSAKSPYNLRMNDDSKINYSSLLKYKRRVSYTKRRVKSASAVEGKCVTKSQRYSLANDIKLSVQPVVVIERNLDLLGITGKVRLICSFNFHNAVDVSDCRQTDINTVQTDESSIASQLCPVVLLENLSLAPVKEHCRTITTRSHSLKHSIHSDIVNGTDLSKSLFDSTDELKRSNSESNIRCDDKISTRQINEQDIKITDDDNVIGLISDDNLIENSHLESIRKSLFHITTRRKKVVTINPVNEVINARESTQNRFGISLQEWEKFSQSNICLVKIDSIVNENSLKKSLHSPRTTLHNNDVSNKDKSEINYNSACNNNKLTASVQNSFMSTSSRKTSKTDHDGIRKSNNTVLGKQSIILKPGKKWFRSLSILRNTHIHNVDLSKSCSKGRKWRDSVFEILENQEGNESAENTSSNEHDFSKTENNLNVRISARRKTLKIVPLTTQSSTTPQCGLSILEKSTANKTGYVSTFTNESVLESFDKLSLTTNVGDREETARQIILKRCGQTVPILFDDCYSQRILKKCRKIGEGVYGEVFMYKSSDNKCHVMKIIPIEGDLAVNGEHQKKFEEIISEIIIASELSNLRTNNEFCTDGFNELVSVACVQGKYPQHLLDLWNLYDEDCGSENDSPEIFTDDQLYIVLELANGGQDLEAYRFNNAEQAYSLFVQVVCSLAVAESALQFEHRDLHWGNILISPTDEPTNTFRLNGREIEVAAKGVKGSIIDFTLSRMTYNNCCIFNDLALDPDLFTATGDYQFEIYRLMRKRNLDDWQRFEPYSNILWLDYTLDKMIHHLRYLRVNTKTHKTFIRRLTQLKKKVLTYNSATEFLNSDVLSHVFL